MVTIVRHRRERPEKCSLTPLEGLPGFAFHRYPVDEPDVADHVRLGFDGPVLSPTDADRPLLILDATWRLVQPMNRRYEHVPPRSLPPLVTAYPRVGKREPDPDGGLASIEAIMAAFHLLGHPVEPLIDRYRWADEFIRRNPAFFQDS